MLGPAGLSHVCPQHRLGCLGSSVPRCHCWPSGTGTHPCVPRHTCDTAVGLHRHMCSHVLRVFTHRCMHAHVGSHAGMHTHTQRHSQVSVHTDIGAHEHCTHVHVCTCALHTRACVPMGITCAGACVHKCIARVVHVHARAVMQGYAHTHRDATTHVCIHAGCTCTHSHLHTCMYSGRCPYTHTHTHVC